MLDFFTKNFFVICVTITMIVILSRKIKTHKKVSIYLIIIFLLTLLITGLDFFQIIAAEEMISIQLTTAIAGLLYVLRPGLILIFILLCGQKPKSIIFYILLTLFGFVVVVNVLSQIPATRTIAYYYEIREGKVGWCSGQSAFLRFLPHIVSVIYLGYLLLISINLLQKKHITDAFGIILCVLAVSIAVILETFFNDDGSVYLLPQACALSGVFYYLFLYERSNKLDVLTGLFNRASYFDDLNKLNKDITAIIQFDMNGLKYINDNYGHLEGDKAIKFIAKTIEENATNKMYAYRLGGDEFIILVIGETDQKVSEFLENFKKDIKNSKYYCSIGYALRKDCNDDVKKMMSKSEEAMYKDKEAFYKNSKFERRKI